MKKLFLVSLLLQNLYAANFISYNTIDPVKFTITDISVINSTSLSPEKKIALIKAYTATQYGAYNMQNDVYLGVDLSTEEGKLLYAQFEKAYWFQQDVVVRCIASSNNQPPDAVIIAKPGQPLSDAQTFPFWTPVIAWSE